MVPERARGVIRFANQDASRTFGRRRPDRSALETIDCLEHLDLRSGQEGPFHGRKRKFHASTVVGVDHP
jgi:hypothetical protein